MFWISYNKYVQNFGSGSGQHQVVSTEALASGTVVDEEEDGEYRCIRLFGNGISVDIFYALLDYRPLSHDSDIVEGIIM